MCCWPSNGLKSNKMRAALTMLGIIIGIAVGHRHPLTVGDGGQRLRHRLHDPHSARQQHHRCRCSRTVSEMDSMMSMETAGFRRFDHAGDARFHDGGAGRRAKLCAISESAGSGKVKDGHRYANISITGVKRRLLRCQRCGVAVRTLCCTTRITLAAQIRLQWFRDFLVEKLFPGDGV